jgi:hypothetical protein
MIELETFESEEFEEALRELREAERCEPCDQETCEYAPLCRYVWATNEE